jgi:hypothetical protein
MTPEGDRKAITFRARRKIYDDVDPISQVSLHLESLSLDREKQRHAQGEQKFCSKAL